MSVARLAVAAPAKVNLFLHVTGRRDDGYHLLESLMVLLDFGDTITLTLRDDGLVRRETPIRDVPEQDDLMLRAAHALRKEAGSSLGVSIAIDKRIPIGAGMGGGSSDAASVLLGLNRLWRLELSRDTLMRIGLALGADVPFFVFGRPAHMRGIGEILRPVSLPRVAFVIAVPPVGLATRDVFSSPGLVRDTPASQRAAFALDHGRNDLQPVAVERQHAIATTLRALDAVAFEDAKRTSLGAARMTGSGSAVFRIVDRAFPASAESWRATGTSERDGWKVLQRIHYRLPKSHDANGRLLDGARLVHARAIGRHPLHDFAAK